MKRYQIEILSPVHIGSGNKISPIEYVLDNRFHRIDMDSLFRDSRFPVDKFIEKAKSSLYLGTYFPDIAKQHKIYSLDVSRQLLIEKKIGEVLEFIKSGGSVYLPGTSIKGAIRTAILYYAIKHTNELKEFTRRYLAKLAVKGGNRRHADDKLEERFFGKITHDFMKTLIVSDSNLLPPNHLKLQLIKVLSTNIANNLQQKLELLAETLKIGSKFEIGIKIDDFYFTEEAKELGFGDKKIYLDNLPQICNEYSRDLIEYELKFFKEYRQEDMVSFYENLHIDKGFLLRLSWGSGWHSMSVARLFQEEPIFGELRRRFRLGKRYNLPIFPKSRKVAVDDKIYPMGWIKLEEVK